MGVLDPLGTPPAMAFPLRVPVLRTGAEQFHASGTSLGFDLLSFWQWAFSDLIDNTLRGAIAEYLVARALSVPDQVRIGWQAYDHKVPSGAIVEVKSAAYLQSWAQKKHSRIEFDIRPTLAWNGTTGQFDGASKRQSDVYVFALFEHKDPATLDSLNVSQWVFYVLNTTALNAAVLAQKTMRLARLRALKPAEATFATLRGVVERTVTAR